MKCVRCEITRAKLRAMYLFHVLKWNFDDVAAAIITDPAYAGTYWIKGDLIMRSPTMAQFVAGEGIELVKLNRT